ncbi:MAG: DUF2071 domain-containing protein [Planctomycetes bacterium]|nr:DUF2071 domain-containing protein [Planctomycetota bacterium]
MRHPALLSTAHRPWPVPPRPWSVTMRWQDLLFLHWPVDPAPLRAQLPPGLELETWQGRAWLGVVPFVMARTRFRRLPPVPTTRTFPELNVRTYVRQADPADPRRGVWFFSLDAASRLAVEGARLGFGLPYFAATMRVDVAHGEVGYRSERQDRRGPPASFVASWRPHGDPFEAAAGSFEQFLVERYCLYAVRRGRLVVGEIAHRPWQLRCAEVRLQTCAMTRLCGVELAAPPASALAAAPLDVAAWSATPVGGRLRPSE